MSEYVVKGRYLVDAEQNAAIRIVESFGCEEGGGGGPDMGWHVVVSSATGDDAAAEACCAALVAAGLADTWAKWVENTVHVTVFTRRLSGEELGAFATIAIVNDCDFDGGPRKGRRGDKYIVSGHSAAEVDKCIAALREAGFVK